jgi:glycerol uptake facilitator-like aquaporin
MKSHIAEAIGTFALTLAVALSLSGTFPVPTPVLAGLVLGLFVYSIGHISGTHINPAVTIGLWSTGKVKNTDALWYIVAQFIGAGLAMFVATKGLSPMATLTVANSTQVLVAETLGTMFFTFGIAAVVFGKVYSGASGAVIGGSLLLGITFAALLGSNGVLNPAVAFGIGSFNLMYVLGPIIGSIIGMNAYKYLKKD